MIPTLADYFLVFALGLILPFLSGIRGHEQIKILHFDARIRKRFYLSNSLILAAMAGSVLMIWMWNKRPFPQMGFRWPEQTPLGFYLVVILSVLYFADLFISMYKLAKIGTLNREWDALLPILPAHKKELPAYILMCFSAGIFEEIMYRGFLVTFFIDPLQTGFPWIAVWFPALLFSMAHFYQGWASMIKIFILSILLALIFILTQSLLYVMIIHILVDVAGGLAAIYMKKNA